MKIKQDTVVHPCYITSMDTYLVITTEPDDLSNVRYQIRTHIFMNRASAESWLSKRRFLSTVIIPIDAEGVIDLVNNR